ncbi:hypothetical protein [Vibrio mediterranei]
MPNPIALLRNDMLVASFRTLRSPNAALSGEQRTTTEPNLATVNTKPNPN